MSRFLWDKEKAAANEKKHTVSFGEASEIFADPFLLSVIDHRFEYGEERWIGIGTSKSGRLLVVAYQVLEGHGSEQIRIVSARDATSKERKAYETSN